MLAVCLASSLVIAPAATTLTGNPTMDAIAKNPAYAKDKVIQEGLTQFKKWTQDLNDANEEVKKAQADVDQAPNPQAKLEAQNVLTLAQGTSHSIQQVVNSASNQVVAQTIYLAKFSIPGAAPLGQSQPAATGK
jgi:hypothetical protein